MNLPRQRSAAEAVNDAGDRIPRPTVDVAWRNWALAVANLMVKVCASVTVVPR